MDPTRALHLLMAQTIDFPALTPSHAAAVLDHPIAHHDPFDVLLLVQAQIEKLQLVTRDSKLTIHPLGRSVWSVMILDRVKIITLQPLFCRSCLCVRAEQPKRIMI